MLPPTVSSAALLFSLFAAPALSLNLLQSAPSCGQTCAILTAGNTACTPPTLTGQTRSGYIGCFCDPAGPNAAFVANPTGACACTTTTEDTQLANWFSGFCNENTATTTPAATPTPTSSPGAVPPTTTGSGHRHHHHHNKKPLPPPPQQNKHETWWAGHYQWIVMVIVLIIAFSAIIAAAIYFKRRYDRRQLAPNDFSSGGAWGPNTSQFRSSSVYGAEETGQYTREKPIRH